ncbi:elongation factor 1-beta domain protein [Trichuris suis]|nr:elongation factor 1-beta domain protein [Trichuris suis]
MQLSNKDENENSLKEVLIPEKLEGLRDSKRLAFSLVLLNGYVVA